jgi:hypothetical protein
VKSLVFVSSTGEDVLQGTQPRLANARRVHSLDELAAQLATIELDDGPRTLDLVGHTTRAAKLMRLGTTILDLTVPSVIDTIEGMTGSIKRCQIAAVRLLGCDSATTLPGQLTIKLLAHTWRVPVWGSRKMISKSHFHGDGLFPSFAPLLLVEGSQLTYPLDSDRL